MARRSFYSFHYNPDNWRASQVRNMGVVDGSRPCSDNDWETITKGGDDKIKKWIADQLDGKSCVIVLIGAGTAGRKWINYEIVKGWDDGKGVLGVHVHNLLDSDKKQATKGANPFASIRYGSTGKMLSSIVKAYDPPYSTSTSVFDYIKKNLSDWVEDAVAIRANA
ncbi:MAG: TIR domain-containing protein [Bryobacteraceae bacterium]|nr:TIR domain-containing protein [Bryobacteraceae bacterium]